MKKHTYKAGDRVYFNKRKYFAIKVCTFDGEQLLSLKNQDVQIKGFIKASNVKPILVCRNETDS